jgi:hypothetical protein
MALTVCLSANTFNSLDQGGHRWVYLNWALGLRALDCDVVWLETVRADVSPERALTCLTALKRDLAPYGLDDRVAVCFETGAELSPDFQAGCLDLESASEADLLLNLQYWLSEEIVCRFPRTALVDIDPGLLQMWLRNGSVVAAPHDLYFTIGEGVGRPGARIPECGLRWEYTPPPVDLEAWAPTRPDPGAAFTTVTHWGGVEIEVEGRLAANSKRDGFLPYLDAIARAERGALEAHGWRVCDAHEVASTPWDYQAYVGRSRGEFSCAKPFYARLASGWVSDRTLCYLASGKPAIVQDTGESGFLPRAEGLFRFRSVDEAARQLEACAADTALQGLRARALAEEHFDARRVLRRVLERALS